ncbi:hypothetical protein [Nostoc spongiaeforme]|nr:hypothetical protein [Nostoc spongiaeforme]
MFIRDAPNNLKQFFLTNRKERKEKEEIANLTFLPSLADFVV